MKKREYASCILSLKNKFSHIVLNAVYSRTNLSRDGL